MNLSAEQIARIEALPDVFLLQGIVQFKYVTGISEPNSVNFTVDMSGGGKFFGTPEQYDVFIDKYLMWLECRA